MTAKFIVIEGLEGAGKSTAIALCQSLLTKNNIEFINTREPGGTPLAEQLRSLVKQEHDEKVASSTELLLMYAARAQLVENVIKPALENNTWVLGDRHDLSSQAYQGGGRGIDKQHLLNLGDIVLQGLKPDLTIYLDIDPKIGLERAQSRGELDRIEQEALSFFERTRQAYLDVVNADESVALVDASQSIDNVHRDIANVLSQFIEDVK